MFRTLQSIAADQDWQNRGVPRQNQTSEEQLTFLAIRLMQQQPVFEELEERFHNDPLGQSSWGHPKWKIQTKLSIPAETATQVFMRLQNMPSPYEVCQGSAIERLSSVFCDVGATWRRFLFSTPVSPLTNERDRDRAVPQFARFQEELSWIAAHRAEYAGQWIALDRDRLISHGSDAGAVFRAAADSGVEVPFVVQIDASEDPLFVGW